MYEIFKNILNGKDYELVDILNKIDEYYVKSKLSKEQKEELEDEARQNANPEKSYADFQKQIDKLADRVTALENKQESTGSEEPAEENIQNLFNRRAHMTHTTLATRLHIMESTMNVYIMVVFGHLIHIQLVGS